MERAMARLHLSADELQRELDTALGILNRGGEVLLERDGEVIARVELAGEGTKTTTAESQSQTPAPSAPPRFFDAFEAAGGVSPEAAMSLLRARAAGGAPFDEWNELAQEEEFLAMLAGEEFPD